MGGHNGHILLFTFISSSDKLDMLWVEYLCARIIAHVCCLVRPQCYRLLTTVTLVSVKTDRIDDLKLKLKLQ